MPAKKIIVSCTFREFDGSENDEIQRLFLDSIKKQTHKDITLAVTNFREKTVRAVIEQSGLDYVFFQSDLDVKFYSISETCYNAASLLAPGDSILLHTSADHIFPPDFFATIVEHMPAEGSVTSFPQQIYDGVQAWKAGTPIEEQPEKSLRLNRNMFDAGDDSDLPPMFRVDPNHWLPDTVAVDGDLLINDNKKDLLLKYAQRDASPGVAQNTLLAFLAKPGKRVNVAMEKRYVELLNDYATDPLAVDGADSYQKIRANQYHLAEQNWENLNKYAEAIGLQPHEYQDNAFLKLDQLEQYFIAGPAAHQMAFKLYLDLWRLRYQARSNLVGPANVVRDAVASLKSAINSLLRTETPIGLTHLGKYSQFWLYGTGGTGEAVLEFLSFLGLSPEGVADTYRKGSWGGYEVVSASGLEKALMPNDAILIASDFWQEISKGLRDNNILNPIYYVDALGDASETRIKLIGIFDK